MIAAILSAPAFISVVAVLLILFLVLTGKPSGVPPGPRGLPIVGYAPFLGNFPWKVMWKLREKYGGIMSLYMGKDLAIILQDYESIRAAFIGQEDTFLGRGKSFVMQKLATGKDGQIHGIVALEGPKWQATSNFVKETLNELGAGQPKMEELILAEIDQVSEAFRQHKGESFDPKVILYTATSSILGTVLFGKRFQYEGEEFRILTKKIHLMFNALSGGVINSYPWLRFVPGPIKQKWEGAQYTMEQQHSLIEKQIENHERTFSDKIVRDFVDAYFVHVAGQDNKDPLAFADKDDLVTSLTVMFSAGPEATHVHMLWSILLLCYNPDVQKKIQEEMDSVIKPGAPVKISHKANLPYTCAALYECLRLGGIALFGVPRSNVKETELLGYHIPARCLVIANLWAANRNPKDWPDPFVFKAERFLDESGKFRIPEHFMLFSMGKRACPGKSVAEMMNYLQFTNVFHHFQFKAPKDTSLPGLEDWVPGVSANIKHYKIEAIPRW